MMDVSHLLGQRITISDLNPLQLVLGNLLKAVTTLSEDVKVLRSDVDGVVHASAKTSMEFSHLKRSVTDTFCTRSELQVILDGSHDQHQQLCLQVSEQQANSSRDRDVLIKRLAAVELAQQAASAAHDALEQRLANVEEHTQRDAPAARENVEALSKQITRDVAALSSRCEKLDGELRSQGEELRRTFHELSAVSEAVVQRADATDSLVQQLSATVDKDRGVLQTGLQRLAAEVSHNESIQAHVSSSMSKVVDAAIDRRVGELQLSLESVQGAMSKKIQHQSTVLDVRIDGIKEHIIAMSNELSDVKSEMSAFGGATASLQQRLERRLDDVSEQTSRALASFDEKLVTQREAARNLTRDAEDRASQIVSDLHQTVDLARQEVERKCKTMIQSSLERHDQVLMETLVSQQRSETERWQSEMDSLRRHVEDSSGFWRLKLSENSNALKAITETLAIDVEKLPDDPADRVRYVRSLPWYPATAVTPPPPTLGTRPHLNNFLSTSGSDEGAIMSATLGLEVRNWALRAHNGHPQQRGVEVCNVVVDGAAYLSGVRVGDVIVAVGDSVVPDVAHFSEALRLETSRGKETPRLWLRREGVNASPERRIFA